MMAENIVLADQSSKVQQKLNQWRHIYDIKILQISAPAMIEGKIYVTMVIIRTPKKE